MRAEIFAPWENDPDTVSTDVIAEEMAMFAQFSRQNNALGGGG